VALRRALIVDDSKSARVVLSRMLQKYNIEVDTAESAETAIDYLVQNRPDVIFMDHLMPGMDGFQAVQAIKNNPRTATIPIMMYTSQEGELYVGQARALGAVGVLPKLVKPVDVSKVLYQLHLLPERRDATPPAFVPANAAAAAATATAGQGSEGKVDAPRSVAGLLPADWAPQLESALRNHDAELRRFVVASFDTFADRVVGDVRNYLNETPALQIPPEAPLRKPPYAWIAALLAAIIPGIVLAVFYSRMLDSSQALVRERDGLAASNQELQAALARQNELIALRDAQTSLQEDAVAQGVGATRPDSPFKRLELVPFGEVPLSGARLEALREMLSALEQRVFRGSLRVESFTGRFCLTGNATEGFALAPAELPASKCDLIGNPFDDGLKPAQRQSLAFANLVAGVPQRTQNTLSVTTGVGGDVPLEIYPTNGAAVTAGEWNAIAARNNRVEFSAVAAP
jgi:CheY-like chemotaxis protein